MDGSQVAFCKCGRRAVTYLKRRGYCAEHAPKGSSVKPPEKPVYHYKESYFIRCKICESEILITGFNSSQKYCSQECAQVKMAQVSKGRYVIFERDSFRCFYCGFSSYGDGKILHADHVYPRSEGGKDIAGNLVTACCECNLSKHDNPIRDLEPIFDEISRRNMAANLLDEQVISLLGRKRA